MSKCQTKPLLPKYSGCLVDNPLCEHAVRFGSGFLCEHPKHKDFFTSEASQIGSHEQYHDLHGSSHHEYISKITKSIKTREFNSSPRR